MIEAAGRIWELEEALRRISELPLGDHRAKEIAMISLSKPRVEAIAPEPCGQPVANSTCTKLKGHPGGCMLGGGWDAPEPRFPIGKCKGCGKDVTDERKDEKTILFCSYECYCND